MNESNDENSSKSWLYYNGCNKPLSEVLNQWNSCYYLRKEDVTNLDNEELFKQWPLYKTGIGSELIVADFEKHYPGKSNCLFQKWKDFSTNILKIYKASIKDANTLDLISQIEASKNENFKNFTIFKILPYILPPVARFEVIKNNKKKKVGKLRLKNQRSDSYKYTNRVTRKSCFSTECCLA